MKFMNTNTILADYYRHADEHNIPRLAKEMLDEFDMNQITTLACELGLHFGVVVKQPHTDVAILQHLCEVANAAAKEVNGQYYYLKDWALIHLVYHHPHECRHRWSWGMSEIVCRTEEYGETSYHTFNETLHRFVDETYEDWSGVRRQQLALVWDDIDAEFKNLVIKVSLNPTYEGKLELNKLANQFGYPCWTDVEED